MEGLKMEELKEKNKIEKKNEIAVHEKKRNKSFERYHKKCA